MNLDTYFQENSGLAIALVNAMEEHNVVFEKGIVPEGNPSYGEFGLLFYSQAALLSQDHNGVLNFYNLGAQKVFLYAPEEAIGMKSIELVPPNFIPERVDEFRRILEERIAVEIQTLRMTKGGVLVKINALVFPYELDSKLSIAARVELIDDSNPAIPK